MSISQTPLKNLFMYIRDLFDVSENYFDFEREPGNPKEHGKHFWSLEELIKLNERCLKKNHSEFELYLEGSKDNPDLLISIKKPVVEVSPTPDLLLEPWLKVKRFHNKAPEIDYYDKLPYEKLKTKEQQNDSGNSEVREVGTNDTPKYDYFTNHPKLELLFHEYKTALLKHYEQNRIPLQLDTLYRNLHSLYYELKGNANRGLFLSFGLVCTRMGGTRFRNFLFQTPIIITLKRQKIELSVDRATSTVTCDAHFLPLLAETYPNRSLQSIKEMKLEIDSLLDDFNSAIHLLDFNADYVKNEFFETALKILQSFESQEHKFFLNKTKNVDGGIGETQNELDLRFHSELIKDKMVFSFSPTIQTRILEVHSLVSRDASRITAKIDFLEQNGNADSIPNVFKKMFVVRSAKQLTQAHEIDEEVKGELIFPKPYNLEQLRIMQSIVAQDAVIVEGPPGTGKSHTIANIISHCVSEGLRVLVASQNAKALTVVRDHIPEGIRDLSVAVLNEGKSNEILKNSVNSIISNMGKIYSTDELNSIEKRQGEVFADYQKRQELIFNKIVANNQEFSILNPLTGETETKAAHSWAISFMSMNNSDPVIMDPIHYQMDTHAFPEQVMELFNLGSKVSKNDFSLADYHYIWSEKLISPENFEALITLENENAHKIDLKKYENIDLSLINDSFMELLEKLDKYFQEFQGKVEEDVLSAKEFDSQLLDSFLEACKSDYTFVSETEHNLVPYVFDVSPIYGMNHEELLQTIDTMIAKLNSGHNNLVGALSFFLPKSQKLVTSCLINGSKVDTLEELKILRLLILRDFKRDLLIRQYNQLIANSFRARVKLSRYQDYMLLAKINDYCQTLNTINNQLNRIGLASLAVWGEERSDYWLWLKNVNVYKQWRNTYDQMASYYALLTEDLVGHPILLKMAENVKDRNYSSYRDNYYGYKDILARYSRLSAFEKKHAALFPVLPKTVQHCWHLARKGEILDVGLSKIQAEIYHRKIESVLTTVLPSIEGLENSLSAMQNIRSDLFKKTADLISYKAWSRLKKTVTEEQKSSLSAWLNALVNVGRRKGIDTAQNLRAAAKHMQNARKAVPVWIMTIQSAITFFTDPAPAQFDVLIMDEASQCDISSFNLIFRAKKSIIVGDKNQTAVVIDRTKFRKDRVQSLLANYFPNHQYQDQFDITQSSNSIYTIGSVIYPDIISLVEHFRCMPEIITFSSKNFYSDRIIPLRTNNLPQIGNSVDVCEILDDEKDPKKPLIVEKVVEEIEELIMLYENGTLPFLPTVGILALDSTNTAHQKALIRALANSELIKAHEEDLKLLVGTSREFQGDERDVMLLTITASHKKTTKNGILEITPPAALTREEFRRIYNVAASRGIYRSKIFHSIAPEAIALMNEDCMRKRILDYYQTVKAGSKPRIVNSETLLNDVDSTLGDFGRQVCSSLIENGYSQQLYPQFKIGTYTLDFALCDGDSKIAIICDGINRRKDPVFIRRSLEQQQVLERVAWKYFRIQSTEWYYRGGALRKKLFDWLATQFGEHR